MPTTNPTQIHATGFIPAPGDKGKPITVIGMNSPVDCAVKHVILKP